MLKMNSLRNKVVIITGASSGIGAGIAVHLAKYGCNLSICGRNVDALKKTADECHELGLKADNILQQKVDVCNDNDLKNLVAKTVDRFGQLDVLVNNAGISGYGSIETITLEDFDRTINVNTRSVLRLMSLTVPYLIKTKGNIVNISSIAGSCSFPNKLAYGMSKAALDQLTKSAALELAPKHVRVNSVNPGVTYSDFHRRSGMDEEQYTEYIEKCKKLHALGRVGAPLDVAKAVAFLASDNASFTTGTILHVDGGRNTMTP